MGEAGWKYFGPVPLVAGLAFRLVVFPFFFRVFFSWWLLHNNDVVVFLKNVVVLVFWLHL